MVESFMMIASMWESMAAWFTPTILFCVTNFIIATIFIASYKHTDHGDSTTSLTPIARVSSFIYRARDSTSLTPIARVSSFIHRARSVNLSSYTTAEPQHRNLPQSKTTAEPQHRHLPQSKTTANYSSTSRLAQSIYLSSNYVEAGQLVRVDSVKNSKSPGPIVRVDSVKVPDSPGQLARAPSFLERVKSFKISSVFNTGPGSTRTENVDSDPSYNPEVHEIRSKSEKTAAKKSSVEMRKSRSEVRIAPEDDEDVDSRRPATARESRNDLDEEVDAKADDFISRFKQQLKLQRLESLVRYNEMLNRRR